ncbi:MAG: TlpA family protein disulfide reductase [Rubripirellula sp.]|nr:TlpA family protein disulfide reductase [Rubripirellula sp.]
MSRAFFVVECIFVIAMLIPTAAAQPPKHVTPLSIGDPFPDIGKRATWLKGTSVESYAKGTVYVLDLWATWCGPCIEMMPHTSVIADRYAKHGVEIIGLALDPGDATATQQFVKNNPNLMRYAICEDIDGQLKTEYMTRTGAAGIPTVLIINQDGMLAWKGHPKNMGGPLAEIVLETYDLEAAKQTLNRHDAATENIANKPAPATDRDALRNIFERKDGNAMVKLADSMMGNKARLVNALGIKGKGLYYQGKFEEAKSTFTSICNESGEFKTQVLCGAAEFLVTEYQDNPDRNLLLAISLAEAAVANRTGQQWPATGTLVLIMDVVEFHIQGNKKEAVKSHKFFAQKIMQYETLRSSIPKESRLTARNRRTILGQ